MSHTHAGSCRSSIIGRIAAMASRGVLGLVVIIAFSSAAFSQQITCPVASDTTNTSSTAFNAAACVINSGVTFGNAGVGTLTNDAGATLTNDGTLSNPVGDLTNQSGGTLTNNGTLSSGGMVANIGLFQNNGTLTNSGFFGNGFAGTLTNGLGGTLENMAGAGLLNNGTLTNNGALLIDSGAVVTNNASITNTSNVVISAGGTLSNGTGATLTNNGIMNNSGAEPDRMYLNPQLIVFVEPVGPNSKVAQLIAQAK
jgi:hypothetical protein